ncbi:MAG: hypothetical protein ACRD19_04505, partial [Terriglobia bacterium]
SDWNTELQKKQVTVEGDRAAAIPNVDMLAANTLRLGAAARNRGIRDLIRSHRNCHYGLN